MNMDNRPGAVDDLTHLYRDTIKHHATHPVGYRQQIDATHQHEEYNPLCGDRILILLRVNEDRLEAAAFEGEACAICMASASLLCEHAPGRTVSHFQEMHDGLHAALGRDGTPGAGDEALNPLLGVKPYPSRIRCATLPWSAARQALASPHIA